MQKLKTIIIICLVAVTARAGANVIVEGGLTHIREVESGSTYNDTIVLRNNGEESADVKLYRTDYRSSVDGSHFYPDPKTLPRSNAGWIAISPLRFTIPAGERYVIDYTLSVPSDQNLAGTYWSMLMIEPIPKGSPESPEFDPEKTQLGVDTVVRYGFRFITHIGDTGTLEPKVINAALRNVEDRLELHIDIENAGTRLLDIDIWAELYTKSGDLVGKFEGDDGGVLPGSSRRYPIGLTHVGTGDYTALVVMDCGDNNVFGATFDLSVD